jgi:hypothetical protein
MIGPTRVLSRTIATTLLRSRTMESLNVSPSITITGDAVRSRLVNAVATRTETRRGFRSSDLSDVVTIAEIMGSPASIARIET